MTRIDLYLGLAASLFSMASFVPQVLKVWRDDENRAVSRRMYVLTVLGFAVWIGYGIARGDAPVVLTNSVCFVLSVAVLARLVWLDTNRAKPR